MRRSLLSGIACIAAVMLSPFLPAVATAEELSFIPTIVGTSGELGIDATLQNNEYTQGSTRTSSSAIFFAERFTLNADGFVYHPRFNVFLARVSPTLNQWDTQTTGTISGSSRGSKSTLDYEFRTIFLPEHPYNLELYALHQESSGAQTFWLGQQGDVNTHGALFTYKEYPFILHMGYNDTKVDSSTNETDTVTYRANGTLRGDIMNQSASYAHSDTTTALMSRITGEDYGYVNTIAYSDLQIYSRISDRTVEQTALPARGFHTDTFMWSEQLTSPLPWHFSTDLSYLYIDENDRTSTTPGASFDQFNRSTSYAARLTHHLYESLTSNFIISRVDISSTLGDITTDSWNVNEEYTKLIPTGRLRVNAEYGQTHYDQSGNVTILNEPHVAPLLGSFTLNSQNIAKSTISIQVKDPPTGAWLDLPPANYLVTPLGRTFQITILNVLPATPQANPAFVYEFRASYSLTNASTIDMTTWGYGADADLIKNLLSGYFQYSRSEQNVVSGFFLGGNDVMVSETLGLRATQGKLAGLVERQVVRSRWTPFDVWRAKANYQNAIAEDVNFSLLLSTERYDYSATPTSIAYRNTIDSLNMGLDYRFPSINLMMFVTTSYTSSRSLVDSDTLSFNSYATWQKGLLTITGGVQINATQTSYVTGRTSIYGDYVYLNMTRKLF